jgi:phosphoglycerate kinase
LGVFEIPAFAGGTLALGTAIAKATQQGAYSLVGGGDSVAAANALGISSQLSYVSTGGGALLECMEGLELPGVAALRG